VHHVVVPQSEEKPTKHYSRQTVKRSKYGCLNNRQGPLHAAGGPPSAAMLPLAAQPRTHAMHGRCTFGWHNRWQSHTDIATSSLRRPPAARREQRRAGHHSMPAQAAAVVVATTAAPMGGHVQAARRGEMTWPASSYPAATRPTVHPAVTTASDPAATPRKGCTYTHTQEHRTAFAPMHHAHYCFSSSIALPESHSLPSSL
jgi:hypothetical protein